MEQYGDIDQHTRTPLLATLVAALVENDLRPTSRAEIYRERWRLLLGDWDRVKGVSRAEIPAAVKWRYIKRLAFDVHLAGGAGRGRLFKKDDMLQTYSHALGMRGYAIEFDSLVRELVLVAGGIIDENDGNYSYGHLSF